MRPKRRIRPSSGLECRFLASSAPRGSARSTRSSGTCGRRRSRTSAGEVDLRADRLRDPQALEPAGDQRGRQQVLLRRRRRERPREASASTSVRQLVDRVTRTIADWGQRGRLLRHRRGRRAVLRRADGALPEPVRLVQLAGLVQRRAVPPATGSSGAANNCRWDEETRAVVRGRRAPTSTPRARPASSSASPTTWKGSCSWPTPRPCSSSSARAPAPTSRPCAPAARSSPAAASRRARSASCGSTTPSPASSSRAARPVAPPRCRPSRSGTPTSSSSSSARPRRRRRPRP